LLLALDAGNTNVTVGLFDGKRLVSQRRVETAEVQRGALKKALRGLRPEAAVLGSVVPPIDRRIIADVREACRVTPIQIGPASPLGIKLRVDKPMQVGADRILNALAVKGPAIIVDFGTATTFDCVAKNGDYLGGAILPGPRLAARALNLFTAKLPEVPVARPKRAIGKNTIECIQAGVFFGYLGMIEKLLALTLKEMRGEGRVKLVATGGLSRLFLKELPRGMKFEPDLTLHGLRLAHERLTR
jgi:type III pantothenate kinase